MTHKDSILEFFNGGDKKERVIGRYWATDIYQITKGYLTPENFFDDKPIDAIGARRILSGMAFESMLHQVYKKTGIKYEEGAKKEMVISPDITLVVKPDFLFKDRLLETKFPENGLTQREIPEKWKHQLECEYQAYKLPVYLGVFSHPFSVDFLEYKNSERRWSNITKGLIDFHNKLTKLT